MTAPVALCSADQVMSRAGKTFYLASHLLPKAVRFDVVHLYAFCRAVDDLADDPSLPLAARRRSLEDLAAALEQSRTTELKVAGWPFAASSVLAQTAGMLVRAALGDLEQRQPETESDLLAYAFGVAGTVGVMMATVLRAAPEGFGAAVALGMAMQLSNISRDVAEDLSMARVYLPKQWVSSQAIDGALRHADQVAAQSVRLATERVLALAASLYEVAYDGIWSLPWRTRWSILAAAMCYREIGVVVGRHVERSWRQRTIVSGPRKLCLVLLAGIRLLQPRFWLPRKHLSWPDVLGSAALAQGQALGVAL